MSAEIGKEGWGLISVRTLIARAQELLSLDCQ